MLVRQQTIEREQNVDPPVGYIGRSPKHPPAKAGQIQPLSGTAFWAHPATVRALVAYTHDAVLTGHAEKARELLAPYLEAIAAYLKPGLTQFNPAKTAFTNAEDKLEAAKGKLEEAKKKLDEAKKKRDLNLPAIEAEYNTALQNYNTALDG